MVEPRADRLRNRLPTAHTALGNRPPGVFPAVDLRASWAWEGGKSARASSVVPLGRLRLPLGHPKDSFVSSSRLRNDPADLRVDPLPWTPDSLRRSPQCHEQDLRYSPEF